MDTNENRLEALDLNQQAVMLIKAGNLETAKERLEKAIALEPMLVDNYQNTEQQLNILWAVLKDYGIPEEIVRMVVL